MEAALRAGKHVLVEKPAFALRREYDEVRALQQQTGRVVCVAENDHYKPLTRSLRALIAGGAIGEMVFALFTTVALRLKEAGDWRNDEALVSLSEGLRQYPRDARLYGLQAKTYAALGKRLLQHQAQGEYYALQGSLPAAIEQLQLARTAGDGDLSAAP